jgi:type I restriction enzyme S subunit
MPNFKQSKEGLLPVNWQIVKLGEVCLLKTETVIPSDNPEVRYVGLEHLESDNPYLTNWGTASEVKSIKYKFSVNDILYGKLRPELDKAVIAEFEGICSQEILVIECGNLIVPQFLVYLLHTRNFLNYAIQTARGVSLPRTSWTSLVSFEFPLPPLSVQGAIAQILQAVYAAKEVCVEERELERERKAALMQDFFSLDTNNETYPTKKINRILLASLEKNNEIVKVLNTCDTQIKLLGQEAALLDELRFTMTEQLMTGQLSVQPLLEKIFNE